MPPIREPLPIDPDAVLFRAGLLALAIVAAPFVAFAFIVST